MSYKSMNFLNFMLLLFLLATIALLIATLVLHSQYTESSNREEMEIKKQKRNNLAIATGVFGGVTFLLLIMRIVTRIRLKAENQKVLNEVKDDLIDAKETLAEARKLADASQKLFSEVKKRISLKHKSDPQTV